ncbi:MAG: hypothetical protein AAF671_12165, partial [Pseudomonadota bacterium]
YLNPTLLTAILGDYIKLDKQVAKVHREGVLIAFDEAVLSLRCIGAHQEFFLLLSLTWDPLSRMD